MNIKSKQNILIIILLVCALCFMIFGIILFISALRNDSTSTNQHLTPSAAQENVIITYRGEILTNIAYTGVAGEGAGPIITHLTVDLSITNNSSSIIPVSYSTFSIVSNGEIPLAVIVETKDKNTISAIPKGKTQEILIEFTLPQTVLPVTVQINGIPNANISSFVVK